MKIFVFPNIHLCKGVKRLQSMRKFLLKLYMGINELQIMLENKNTKERKIKI